MSTHAVIEDLNSPAGDWVGFSWQEASLAGEPNFDFGLCEMQPGSGRLAVFDAAVPPGSDLDRLQLMGETLRAVFTSPGSLVEAAVRANRWLCDPALRPRQRNPIFAAAAVELDFVSAELSALCCGDCEVWVLEAGEWRSLFDQCCLRSDSQARFAVANAAAANEEESWAVQFDVLDDPACWRRPPLGLSHRGRVTLAGAERIDGVIVSSDGARLNASRCASLRLWLAEGIHDVGDNWPHRSPHGDLFVYQLLRRNAERPTATPDLQQRHDKHRVAVAA